MIMHSRSDLAAGRTVGVLALSVVLGCSGRPIDTPSDIQPTMIDRAEYMNARLLPVRRDTLCLHPLGSSGCEVSPNTVATMTTDGKLILASVYDGLRRSNPNGSEAMSFGAVGHGDNEFESALALGAFPDGGVFLLDLVGSKALVYDSTGTVSGMWALEVPRDIVGMMSSDVGPIAFTHAPSSEVGNPVLTGALRLRGLDTLSDTLASWTVPAIATNARYRPIPGFFQARPTWAACRDGTVILAPEAQFTLVVFPAGAPGTKRIMGGAWAGRAVSRDDVNREMERRSGGRAERSQGKELASLQEAAQKGLEKAAASAPTNHPAITDLHCTENDVILIRESTEAASDSVRWVALSLSGTPIGEFYLGASDRIAASDKGRLLIATKGGSRTGRVLVWLSLEGVSEIY